MNISNDKEDTGINKSMLRCQFMKQIVYRFGSPIPLEPTTTQREAGSIYWLFQDQT